MVCVRIAVLSLIKKKNGYVYKHLRSHKKRWGRDSNTKHAVQQSIVFVSTYICTRSVIYDIYHGLMQPVELQRAF